MSPSTSPKKRSSALAKHKLYAPAESTLLHLPKLMKMPAAPLKKEKPSNENAATSPGNLTLSCTKHRSRQPDRVSFSRPKVGNGNPMGRHCQRSGRR